jgi:hypothetical protein
MIKTTRTIICLIACLVLASLAVGCKDDRAILDELATNRLKVVFKGTYASNAPVEEWMTVPDSEDPLVKDESVVLCQEPADPEQQVALPTRFMIDIAEMKLNKHKFANYRETKTFSLDESSPFFSGEGVVLKNDDPVHLHDYSRLKLYTRKMIFDGAKIYRQGPGGWQFKELSRVIFSEKKIDGFNINQLQKNSHYDSLRKEANYINRIYPVNIPIVGGFRFNRNYDEMVLEIRMLVKNYYRKYEYSTYDDEGLLNVIHYFGFSDWLRDVRSSENNIGGNIVAVARAYVPAITGTIGGSNPNARDVFVIAIPAGDPLTRYALVNPGGFSGSGNITEEGEGLYRISTGSDHSLFVFSGDYLQIDHWAADAKYFIEEVASDHIVFLAEPGRGAAAGVAFNIYPATSRDSNPCDLPIKPAETLYYMNSALDYYLSLDSYQSRWNDAIDSCNAMDNPFGLDSSGNPVWTPFKNYSEAWFNYNESLEDIVLPPLAAFAEGSGSYILENVMPGSYDLYVTNAAAGDVSQVARFGELFYHDEFDFMGSLTLTDGAVQTLDIP